MLADHVTLSDIAWIPQYSLLQRNNFPFERFSRFMEGVAPVKIIACIEVQLVIKKTLDHLDAKSAALASANQLPESRAPPQARLFQKEPQGSVTINAAQGRGWQGALRAEAASLARDIRFTGDL